MAYRRTDVNVEIVIQIENTGSPQDDHFAQKQTKSSQTSLSHRITVCQESALFWDSLYFLRERLAKNFPGKCNVFMLELVNNIFSVGGTQLNSHLKNSCTKYVVLFHFSEFFEHLKVTILCRNMYVEKFS